MEKKLGRVGHWEIMAVYKEDTVQRNLNTATAREYTPYVKKQKKEKTPVYPVKSYTLSPAELAKY